MKKKKGVEVSEEEIEKAFDQLSEETDLVKAELDSDEEYEDEEDDLEKAAIDDEDDEELDDEDFGEEDDLEKAADDEDDEEETSDEEDEAKLSNFQKGKKKKKVKKTEKAEEDELGSKRNEEVQKGVEVSPFLEGLVADIEKANKETRRVLGNVATVTNNLISISKDLVERVGELEKAMDGKPARARKSRLKKTDIIERDFDKSVDSDLENSENEDGKTVLGIAKNYTEIINLLDAKAFGDGTEFNEEFAKAMTGYETTKSLPANIVAKLEKEDNIFIKKF